MKYTEHLSTIAIRTLSILMTTGILLVGCERQEQEILAPGIGDNAGGGKQVTFSIRLQGVPEYNAPDGETRGTRSGEPLIAGWVKVNSFDATRPVEEPGEVAAGNESGGPRIALMELREDTVPVRAATRGVMPAGYTFRVIAFWKSPTGSYEFRHVADYVSKGDATPELKRGEMYLPVGQTCRFVAYSFNNAADMGVPLPAYVWNETSVSIPHLSYDFMTYDSGDQTIPDENFTLPVSFKQQLCKLTVKISVTGFADNTFTNCTGVYIGQGGESPSWTIGTDAVTATAGNSGTFDIPDNSTDTAVRLVPFDTARPVTVHFSTLIAGSCDAGNTNIISSQSVQLKGGKSYTLTAQFKKAPGIKVAESEIDPLHHYTNCTDEDKHGLSLLRWADGNLINDENNLDKLYDWTTPTGQGYYYTFYSTYTGNTSENNTDPCSKLDPAIYGAGWRTPSKNEIIKLSHCTDIQIVSYSDTNSDQGMWFMNKPNGLFLPAAGYRSNNLGSGIEPSQNSGRYGYYWTSVEYSGSFGYNLSFSSAYAEINYDFGYRAHGFSVRCVKGAKQ